MNNISLKTSTNNFSSPLKNYYSLSGFETLMYIAQRLQLPETTGVLVTRDAAGFPQGYHFVTEADTAPDLISIKSTKRHFLSSILQTPGLFQGNPEELNSIVKDDQTPLTIGQIRQVLKQEISPEAWSQSKIQQIKSGQTISDPSLVTDDQPSVRAEVVEFNRQIGIEEKQVNHVLDAYFQESKSPIAINLKTIKSLNFLDPKDRQCFEQTKKEILGQVEELKTAISQSEISSDASTPYSAEDCFRERIPVNALEESMKKLFGHYDSLKKSIEQVEERTLPHAASTSL